MAGKFEVLIRGAGPAGTVAAAWLAREGRTVALLHSAQHSPVDRIEALGPDLPALLSRIGLDRKWLGNVARPVPGTISRWAGQGEEIFDAVMSPHGTAWSTSRITFDQALRAHAGDQGVTIVDEEVAAAKLLISVGSDKEPKGIADDKLVALTRNYHDCPMDDHRLRIESVPQGWWYALPASADRLGVGFVTDRQTIKDRSLEEVWHSALDGPIREIVAQAKSSSALRGTPVRCALVEGHANRIGNARASYDPLTGRGVAEAIRNALDTVSQAEQNWQPLPPYLGEHYASYLRKRAELYRLGANRYGTGFWTRRLSRQTDHLITSNQEET